MGKYNPDDYYVDFDRNENLTKDQKKALKRIQKEYLPIERAVYLAEYRNLGLISSDEFLECTGIPYDLDQ